MINLNKKKDYLTRFFKLLITIILFIYVFNKINLNNFLETVEQINFLSLVFILLLSIILAILPALRSFISINTICAKKVTWLNAYQYFLIGMFYNNILPSSIGGDVARVYLFYKETDELYKVSSAIILERLIGLITTIIIFLVAFLFWGHLLKGYMFLYYALAVGIVVGFTIFIIFNPLFFKVLARKNNNFLNPIFKTIEKFLLAMQAFKGEKKVILKLFLLSFLYQVADIFIAFLLAKLLHINISFSYFLLFIPIVYIITLLPITINGLGLRENIIVYLFSLVGVLTSSALLLSLLIYLDRVIKGLVGGIVLLFYNLKGGNRQDAL